jgi:hypothetical protein
MATMTRDTQHQGLPAGVARLAAPAALVAAAEPFAFAGLFDIPKSIQAHQAWQKMWELRPAYSVNHTDRTIPRPLERSP